MRASQLTDEEEEDAREGDGRAERGNEHDRREDQPAKEEEGDAVHRRKVTRGQGEKGQASSAEKERTSRKVNERVPREEKHTRAHPLANMASFPSYAAAIPDQGETILRASEDRQSRCFRRSRRGERVTHKA